MKSFTNRQQAGQLLGERLLKFKDQNPIILAIPRGGVPVAFEVAKKLKAPLDILMVKKIGSPGNPEFAVGAVSEDSKPLFNEALIKAEHIDRNVLNKTAQIKIKEIREQLHHFRGSAERLAIKDKVVIIVDDGIATGATLFSAIQFLREKKPAKIIIASPVGARDTIYKLQAASDEVICLQAPENFRAVGLWYDSFNQVADEEVIELLREMSYLKSHGLSDEVAIRCGEAKLKGSFTQTENMKAIVLFAHGSGSSRLSPRNQFIARELNKIGYGTLLFDLLTENESLDRKNVFDIELPSKRLIAATDWVSKNFEENPLPIAYLGASTGAGAALMAAAQTIHPIYAVISRGGRPDLAEPHLKKVTAATLLIVGEEDGPTIVLNEKIKNKIANCKMVLIPHATHLFEEPGTLESVVEYTSEWLEEHLPKNLLKKQPKEIIVEELEKRSHVIDNEHSWDQLIQKISHSRIVMLGEATHGTKEFYSIRRYISERLIKEHGFSFIAVEGDWPDCQKINDYILKDQGNSAAETLREFKRWPTWMWANEETPALIEWLKNFKVGFYGLDVYSLFESMDYVKAFAEKLDPQLAQALKEQYACFDPFNRNEKAYARHLVKFPEGCRQEVLISLKRILRLRMSELATQDEDLFNAQQNARIVANAEQYYRTMLFGGPESWNIRDHHMLETLETLLRKKGSLSKCIVWAHNSHIGDYHATDMNEEGYVNLGGLARERFGVDNVSLVGFGSYEGQVLAGPAWGAPAQIMNLPPALESSYDFYCHKVAKNLATNRFYTIFDRSAQQGVLGKRRYGHRAVGVVYSPHFEDKGHNYVPTIPAQRYDAFVFVDKTTALKSLHANVNKLDMPDTWPGGF
jgi:erythromycin esterase-like protein/predicted phosphoribosyltransferase/predicted alpha/beta-hydrolase family hydrolase